MTRLVHIFILLILPVAYLFLGRARRRGFVPQSVLIIQLAKLGDMVCTTPMFRAVKKFYPHCQVVVVGLPSNEELLRGNGDVDEFISFHGSLWPLWQKIKKSNFDFACVATPNFVSLALMYLAGISSIAAPIIINGFSPYVTRPYKLLLNFVIRVPHAMGSYAPGEYLKLLEPIGVSSADTTKHLSFSGEALNRVTLYFNNHGLDPNDFIVGIAPGAGHKIKQWPPERLAQVADYLVEKHQAKVILIGGPNDKKEGEELKANMKNKASLTDTVGSFSIAELKALISRFKLLVAADTGPIYIAEAFGVATVDIVGPMDENEQPPRGKRHAVVVAEREAPAMHIMNARQLNWQEARRQVEAITVNQVTEAVDRVIAASRDQI